MVNKRIAEDHMKNAKGYRDRYWIDPRIDIHDSPISGTGMFATEPILQGKIVTVWGGNTLLTDADLSDGKAKALRQEGYVWATIGEGRYLAQKPEKDEDDLTEYINHSCDPNVWMRDEVTLVARRDILVGEELTIDYAMFEGDENWAPDWICKCGSANCRGRFTGKDWLLDDLQKDYKGHLSPFINERI